MFFHSLENKSAIFIVSVFLGVFKEGHGDMNVICSYLLITPQVDTTATHAQITANLAAPIEQQDSGS